MSYSENTVFIKGNIGGDPDMKFMTSGDPVTNISVCTNRRWKDRNTGEEKNSEEWHYLVFYNRGNYKLAEYASQLKKGACIRIKGYNKTRKWIDTATVKGHAIDRYRTEIIVEEMEEIVRHKSNTNVPVSGTGVVSQQTSHGINHVSHQAPLMVPAMAPPTDDFDDDIPF